jgi:D-alanyl-D-alanine carboxypeptidase
MKRWRLAGMIVAGGWGAVACELESARAEQHDLRHELQVVLDSLRQADGFPGATAAVALADGRVVGIATGLADRERRMAMTPDTRMFAASIGKMFVAATAVSLAHEGKLDLDAPIARYLGDEPWFSRLGGGSIITLRMLLSHSAGVRNHVGDPRFVEAWRKGRAADPDFTFAPREAIAFVLDQPPLYPPGHGFEYTDTGYLIVGVIVERATGSAYYDLVTKRFLQPLDLRLTRPSDRRDLPNLAAGYSPPNNALGLPANSMVNGRLTWNPALEWTGGGLASNSQDLVRWAKALFEGRAMAGSYLPEMLAGMPGNPALEPGGSRYGLGIRIAETALGTTYGHGGSMPGHRSQLIYFPDRKVAIAIQVNTDVAPVTDRLSAYTAALAKVALNQPN